VGAEAAAERLRGTDAWRQAAAVKANPDAPQWPVRQRALEDGKTLYMAVPRLAEERPFFLLDPAELVGSPRAASSIKGASKSARTVDVEDVEPVDLVVTGCVAVGREGARLGKGGGFSDLEFAIAWAAGLIGPDTVVATTVHPLQVRDTHDIPTTAHDMHVDLVVTPDEVIATGASRAGRRPPALDWDELTDEKVAAIPVLGRLRPLRPEDRNHPVYLGEVGEEGVGRRRG
jgi:5-formyltetrahydrofolate cyclo-ligase